MKDLCAHFQVTLDNAHDARADSAALAECVAEAWRRGVMLDEKDKREERTEQVIQEPNQQRLDNWMIPISTPDPVAIMPARVEEPIVEQRRGRKRARKGSCTE